eukprot:Gregarina_sp_Poly_1__959@NODE_1233_length_4694_cov_123_320078_g840_i0_p1_GENE_NODE_1233_length_4694_cov_123_320078_g840_i0NODE_1233_length_4694_cov_123_320078_g840_i0_p1_ORF_typecomplete_len583_score48_28_NODE_1233_length_4694_cov_123_320078_g840_i026014349
MKSVQVQYDQNSSKCLTLSTVLIGCEEILYGTGEFAFKCQLDSRDFPPEDLAICPVLEAFKVESRRDSFMWESNEDVQVISVKNLARAKLYERGASFYSDYVISETAAYEEDYDCADLTRTMEQQGLILRSAAIADRFFRDWKMFLADETFRRRIFALVGRPQNQTKSMKKIFLEFQLLFLYKEVLPAFEGPIIPPIENGGKLKLFQNLFRAITQRHKVIINLLGDDSLFNGNNELRKNLVKDMEKFYFDLDNHAVSEVIEDCINLGCIFTEEDCESQLRRIVYFCQEARKVISNVLHSDYRQNAILIYTLSSIRLLYISLQAADRIRKVRTFHGRKFCTNHSNDTDTPRIRNRVMGLLKEVFAAQISCYKSGLNEWPCAFAVRKLREAGIQCLEIKDCGLCDLDHLRKICSDLPSRQELGLTLGRKAKSLKVGNHTKDPKFYSRERIESARKKLFSIIQESFPSFAIKPEDDQETFLSKTTLVYMQHWILTKASFSSLSRFANVLHSIRKSVLEKGGRLSEWMPSRLSKVQPRAATKGHGADVILIYGLTYREAVAAMLQHLFVLWDPHFSLRLRRKHIEL